MKVVSTPRRNRLAAGGTWFLTTVFLIVAAQDAEAVRVRALGLADMTKRAGQIFVGECIERSVHDDGAAGPHTTYVFRVLEPIKGVAAPAVSFTVAATPEGRGFVGLPVFDVGERALLLLYPPGPGGRTSPLGLDQGRFRLVRRDGTVFAVNGRGNRGLLRDVPEGLLRTHGLAGRTGGPIPSGDLERLLEALVREAGP